MIKEEKREVLRKDTRERKWTLIKNQMKSSIQGSFTILSVIDLLKSVCFSYPIKIETPDC